MAIANPSAENLLCKTDWNYTTNLRVLDYKTHASNFACAGSDPMHIALQWQWDDASDLVQGSGENQKSFFGYRVYRTPVTVCPDGRQTCCEEERVVAQGGQVPYNPSYGANDPTVTKVRLRSDSWSVRKNFDVSKIPPLSITANPCSEEEIQKYGYVRVADIIDAPADGTEASYFIAPNHVEWYNDCKGTFNKILKASGIDHANSTFSGQFIAEFVEDLSAEMGCCPQGTQKKFGYMVQAMMFVYNGQAYVPQEAQTKSDCVVANVECCKYITASDIEVTASCSETTSFSINLLDHVQLHGYSVTDRYGVGIKMFDYPLYHMDYNITYKSQKDEQCWSVHGQQETQDNFNPESGMRREQVPWDGRFGNNDDIPKWEKWEPWETKQPDWDRITRKDWVNQRILDMLEKWPIPIPPPERFDVWGASTTFPQVNFDFSQVPNNNDHFILEDQYGTYLKFIFDTSKTEVERNLKFVYIPMNGVSTTAATVTKVIQAINHVDVRETVDLKHRTNTGLRIVAKVNPNNTNCVQLMMTDPGPVFKRWQALSFANVNGVSDVNWMQWSARTNIINPAITGMAGMEKQLFGVTGAPIFTFENNCCCDDNFSDCPDRKEGEGSRAANAIAEGARNADPCCGVEYYEYTVWDPEGCCGATGSIKVVMPPAPVTDVFTDSYDCTELDKYGTIDVGWRTVGECYHRFEVWRTQTPEDDSSWVHIGNKYNTIDPLSGSYWMRPGCGQYYNVTPSGNKYLPGSPPPDGTTTGQTTTDKTVYDATQGGASGTGFAGGYFTTWTYNDPRDNFIDGPEKQKWSMAPNPTEPGCANKNYYYKIVPCCVAPSASLITTVLF